MSIDLTKPGFHLVPRVGLGTPGQRELQGILLVRVGSVEAPIELVEDGPEETLPQRISAAKRRLAEAYPKDAEAAGWGGART